MEEDMERNQRWLSNKEKLADWYKQQEMSRESYENRKMNFEDNLTMDLIVKEKEEKRRKRHLMEMRIEEERQTCVDGFWGLQVQAMKEYKESRKVYEDYERKVKIKHMMMKKMRLVL